MGRFDLLLIALIILLPGCAFGPKAIEGTHGKYSASVQKVEEEEFLKNIVRLRYLEEPRNLEVTSIAAQYEVAMGAEARPFFSTESINNPSLFRSFSTVLPFLSGNAASRPTVSLSPQDDGSSVRQFMTPITFDTISFLIQSGWPASTVFRIWFDRLNGVPNYVSAVSPPPREKPSDFERFLRVIELLQVMQDRELANLVTEDRMTDLSGPLPPAAVTAEAAVEAAKAGYEYRPHEDGKTWTLIKRSRRVALRLTAAGRASPEMKELSTLLNLKPNELAYELIVASGVPDPLTNPGPPGHAIRMAPRSTAQALFYISAGVEVPPEHVACGLVHIPNDGVDPQRATQGLFHIRSCKGRQNRPPECAYAAVWYRDYWFYIDDRDHESKATLMLMLQLRRLDFKRQEISRVPVLTLPAGR